MMSCRAEDIDIPQYMVHKSEVKSLIENDEEDISNFMIRKKMNLAKEKNENIKNMKKLILKYPDIFIKSSIITRELKKNIQDNKALVNNIIINCEKITRLFEGHAYKQIMNNLKYSKNEHNITRSNMWTDIFKIPLIIHKNNEKENVQDSMKYINMCDKIKIYLCAYCNCKSKDHKFANYLKGYIKKLDKEIKKTRGVLCELIMKCENVDTIKMYLQYLSDIRNYFLLPTDQKGMSEKFTNNIEKNNLTCSDFFFESYEERIMTNEEYRKNTFLMLKHFYILQLVKGKLEEKIKIQKTNNSLSTEEIIQNFLNKIDNLKNTYEKLFNILDAKLFKHIIFLYYFSLSLVHIKIKQTSNHSTISCDQGAKKCDLSLINAINREYISKKVNQQNEQHGQNEENLRKNKSNVEDAQMCNNVTFHNVEDRQNAQATGMEEIINFVDIPEKVSNSLTYSNEVNASSEKKILEKEFANPDGNPMYPFLNLNSSLFNYMYYFVFFKTEKIYYESHNLDLDESESKEHNLHERTQCHNWDDRNPSVFTHKERRCYKGKGKRKIQMEKSYERDKIPQKNHFTFVNFLYEERSKNLLRKIQSKKITKQKYMSFTNYTSIQTLVQKGNIKESVLDLYKCRKNNEQIEIAKENENFVSGLSAPLLINAILNKIFIMYIYDFLEKNNFHFYQNILFFDDKHEQNENNTYNKNIICVLRGHIQSQKGGLPIFEENFSTLGTNREGEGELQDESKTNRISHVLHRGSMQQYMGKIYDTLKHTFLITYFFNIVFLLKSIKYYVDKSLIYVIIFLFENSFKRVIENLVMIFLGNQNMFLKYSTFHLIMELLFKIIFPFTFTFLSYVFQVDVTSSTENIFKILDNYGVGV
ncbi:hypothetical protein, conserved [Plasmodium gonderi]|uniref:Uncharacterized protein n=1 Tax=Plasmodium gonderi TaxID=77519 RepID=A0A1Y1JHD3_PLAGO|nr:hypothetical protein, conserved [Plasmodium gonderi]GAW81931.1 hypothetical protein, conserved [Plasmodium gonderi]